MNDIIIAHTKRDLKDAISAKRSYKATQRNKSEDSITLGFTPTMGALHAGHKSLIEQSIKENDISVVSIFVNPTQFGPNEDLDKYPRTLESDIAMCKDLGADIIFAPDSKQMYEEEDEITLNPPKSMGYILEGYYRPTHFAGVIRIVLKLFNLIKPHNAYFGKKDAQQLLIIQKMTKHLCIDINIRGMPIIRDKDGLALSSRNVYLSAKDRELALRIPRAISFIDMHKNTKDIESLKRGAYEILGNLEIDYMDFYNRSLQLTQEIKGSIFLLCVRVGKVRLLDNLWLD